MGYTGRPNNVLTGTEAVRRTRREPRAVPGALGALAVLLGTRTTGHRARTRSRLTGIGARPWRGRAAVTGAPCRLGNRVFDRRFARRMLPRRWGNPALRGTPA